MKSETTTVVDKVPSITIDAFTGDNKLIGAEREVDQIFSGSTVGLPEGNIVFVSVGDENYATPLAADGSWQVTLPASLLQGFEINSTVDFLVKVQTENGWLEQVHKVLVEPPQPTITLNPFAGDNFLTLEEIQQDLEVTGVVSNIPDSAEDVSIEVILGYKTYQVAIEEDGSWSLTVSAYDLQALAAGYGSLEAYLIADGDLLALDTLELEIEAANEIEFYIDTFTGDDILTPDEAKSAQTLFGSSNLPEGTVIEFQLAANDIRVHFPATVAKDGRWSVEISPEILQSLPAGKVSITTYYLGMVLYEKQIKVEEYIISINPFAGDDILTPDEAKSAQTLSGSSNLPEGAVIQFQLVDKVFEAKVGEDGSWLAQIPPEILQSWPAGDLVIKAGVEVGDDTIIYAEKVITVIAAPEQQATITVDPFTGDNILTHDEKGSDQLLFGTTQGIPEGSPVFVDVGGYFFSTSVNADGSWQVTIPSSTLQQLTPGEFTITAKALVSNEWVEITQTVQVNYPDGKLSIEPFTGDNILTYQESHKDQEIFGWAQHVKPGTKVVVQLGELEFETEVQENGQWKVKVTSEDLLKLPVGELNLSAWITDGNGSWIPAETKVVVEGKPQPTITLDMFAGDNVLDPTERGEDQRVSGSTTGLKKGELVVIYLDGKFVKGAIVGADGSWSTTISKEVLTKLAVGTSVLKATASDGKQWYETQSEIAVLKPPATITIDPFTSDNHLSYDESTQSQVISGKTEWAKAGIEVLLLFGDKNYRAEVQADGSWSVSISADDLKQIPEGKATILAWIEDGDERSNASLEISVEGQPKPGIFIEVFSAGEVLDAAERGQDQQIVGSTKGIKVGELVLVSLNGKFIGVTQVGKEGEWNLTVASKHFAGLQEGGATFSAKVLSSEGWVITELPITVEPLPIEIILDKFAGDNILSYSESKQEQLLSGTTLNAKSGTEIWVTLGEQEYRTLIQADGSWSVRIGVEDLAALVIGTQNITVKLHDGRDWVTTSSELLVEGRKPAIEIHTFAGDNVLDGAESMKDQLITGSTTDIKVGEWVIVSLNGKSYVSRVDSDGNWQLSVSKADLAALPAGKTTISAKVHSKDGWKSTEHEIEVIGTKAAAFSSDGLDNFLISADSEQGALAEAMGALLSSTDLDSDTLSLLSAANEGDLSLATLTSSDAWSQVGRGELAATVDTAHTTVPVAPVEELPIYANNYAFG